MYTKKLTVTSKNCKKLELYTYYIILKLVKNMFLNLPNDDIALPNDDITLEKFCSVQLQSVLKEIPTKMDES